MKTQQSIEKKQAYLLNAINEILGVHNKIIDTTIDLPTTKNNHAFINFYLNKDKSMMLSPNTLLKLSMLGLTLYLNTYTPHLYYIIDYTVDFEKIENNN